ncbi:molybdopterin molybdenumtransferase MoeA [Xylanibacillus composti]|uniref:Molybdopterin molybdenumtransferase n=1 Tax=Xylanibacillus composti TaxID=1572762 RepID=A0A8J4H1J8_9BACL|nr:gephyrin-like molybdotransferase Glp [Xylanibacillus composti]MDT9725807.1 molybdopterin molybdenumtransferase MoeA [Xylanibacillus composti]GIQ69238.1 molybdopterin molybdenumtransferase [Xylanibacillus composti]
MKFNRRAVSVEEAQRRVLSCASELDTEQVALEEAWGRWLAADIQADHPVPHFPRSGMDGYALRALDTAGASPASMAELEVLETIACGQLPTRKLGKGQASRIMTGACVPEGADAVVMLEQTNRRDSGPASAGDKVGVKREVRPGENITPVGYEIEQSETVLRKGERITAGEVAVLATFGHAAVPVYRRPKVAIISTGTELLQVTEAIQPGKIRNSNSHMIAALVREAGAVPVLFPPLPDHAETAIAGMEEAWSQADLMITTGGVSVGDYDILTEWFAAWPHEDNGSAGRRVLFNKVAMRPGSPTTAAVSEGRLLLALSGNPGACFVGYKLFAEPVLRAMQGAAAPVPRTCRAVLDVSFPKPSPFPRYVRACGRIEGGQLRVAPAGPDKSSMLKTVKDGTGLILIPAGGSGAVEGQLVDYIDFAMQR